MLDALLEHRLSLSVKAIAVAKEAAWRDLPMDDKKIYLRHAEQAVLADEKEQKPS